MELELDPVRGHLVDEVEHSPAEPRERSPPAPVVALVAVRPEAHEPGHEEGEVARAEVEGGVDAEERPEAIQGEAGLRERPGLRGRDPAAVAVRGGLAGADRPRLDDRHVGVTLAQVVGRAEAGHPAPDDDDLHEGMPAVTSTSISMPGTVNPVTMVVRTGRGAGNVSAQTRFQAAKSSARSR